MVVTFVFASSRSQICLSFLWLSRLSSRGRGVKFVRRFRGRNVCLRVVAESNSFVVFVVVTFVFAWLRSQMDVVSWLHKPILVLLEGGAA